MAHNTLQARVSRIDRDMRLYTHKKPQIFTGWVNQANIFLINCLFVYSCESDPMRQGPMFPSVQLHAMLPVAMLESSLLCATRTAALGPENTGGPIRPTVYAMIKYGAVVFVSHYLGQYHRVFGPAPEKTYSWPAKMSAHLCFFFF